MLKSENERQNPKRADFPELSDRLGKTVLRKRLENQVKHGSGMIGQSEGIWRIEDYIPIDALIKWTFKLCGLYNRGRRNYLDIQVFHNEVHFPNLPQAFDGYKILHIADLHTDLDPDLPDAVIKKLDGLKYDLCVNTGDYRNKTKDCYLASLRETRKIAAHIRGPHFGILGNHDFIEKVAELEAMGIRILLNESIELERKGCKIWLSGIDDSRFYQTHDIQRARAQVPDNVFSILLSHSPDTYEEASEADYDFMLSGHTHGGQICLPGGIPVVTHCHCPSAMVAGSWRHQKLQGYTSRGTGGGSAPLRFNCPAEMTIHTLRRGVA